MRNAIRSFLAEPRVPDPPGPMKRDWALVGVAIAAATVEAIFRTDLPWPAVHGVLVVALALLLPWRRTYPLATVVLAFGSILAVEVVATTNDISSDGLYTAVLILVLPYALLRWASGRHVAIGLVVFLPMAWWVSIIQQSVDIGEAIGGTVILMLPAAIGASVRYRETSRVREREQVILREREQLARELHDTVAHHVSAIAIQAQAGQAVAATDPAAAIQTLNAIERAASQTLGEMRTLVGALRSGDAAELAPQPGVGDIGALATGDNGELPVAVRLSGNLDDIPPSIDAAVYRMAQESITNARRHARHATNVDVQVEADDDAVRLTVSDNGDPTHFDAHSAVGYGLIGMAERARLLGGTLQAGPRPGRGWMISAILPKTGPTA
jgi:signal transduction histidine kinase